MKIALIMAAGSGTRMGNDIPKQFIEIGDKPLIWYTISVFNNCKEIDAIYIVSNPKYFNKLNEITFEFEKVLDFIPGGETRQESVFNGIKYLTKNGMIESDIVLIHDAARPFVTEEIVKENINKCEEFGAVVTSIKACDSIVRSLDGTEVNNNENRNELYQNQTPQTFKLGIIKSAYEKCENCLTQCTDDAQVAINAGNKIHLAEGSKLNFKITTKEDLELAKALIEKKD